MQPEKIFDDISNLPPEAQRQVVEFIAFLRSRYKRSDEEKQIRQTNIVNEPFIGIWKDREDMNNSSTWLRNLRESEWSKST